MGIANFFEKTALAASQILYGYNRNEFEAILLNANIEVAFDNTANSTSEGKSTLELTVRLLARLYPNIIFTPVGLEGNETDSLMKVALAINPHVQFNTGIPTATIVVGETIVERNTPVFYIGSCEWTVRFSSEEPVGSYDSALPFAAGAAACFGAANVFRYVFREQLPNTELDRPFNLSLIDYSQNETFSKSADIPMGSTPVKIPDTVLVGLGAIGNGAVWALSKMSKVQGTLHLVDPEEVDISNLQRYVVTEQLDINGSKIEVAASVMQSSSIRVTTHKGDWASFLNSRNNWDLDMVLAAVDTAKDRIAIQASLPRYLLNAWTQSTDLGVSRHFNFAGDACLACLYPPHEGEKSISIQISESLGLPQEEGKIREMLYNNDIVDEAWLHKIAVAKEVSPDALMPHLGKPIGEFCRSVFCGGVIITHKDDSQVETPMAFQSALAGIMLSAELIIHAQQLRVETLGCMSRIDLLRPLTKYLNEAMQKSASASCICKDEDFRKVYSGKYS